MKSILFILISLIAISCGGSSGGGGGASTEDGCSVNAMCREDRFVTSRPLNIDEAKRLLSIESNIERFENIYPGMSFIEVTNCYAKEGDLKSGFQVLRHEVKSWDNDSRTVVMKVIREVKADDNSCARSLFDYDEYVVHKKISSLDTYLKRLDDFSLFYFGKIANNEAIRMFKKENFPEYSTETESVVDMTKTILTAISSKSKGLVGSTLYASNEVFFEMNEDVNPDEIDINGLPVINVLD